MNLECLLLEGNFSTAIIASLRLFIDSRPYSSFFIEFLNSIWIEKTYAERIGSQVERIWPHCQDRAYAYTGRYTIDPWARVQRICHPGETRFIFLLETHKAIVQFTSEQCPSDKMKKHEVSRDMQHHHHSLHDKLTVVRNVATATWRMSPWSSACCYMFQESFAHLSWDFLGYTSKARYLDSRILSVSDFNGLLLIICYG